VISMTAEEGAPKPDQHGIGRVIEKMMFSMALVLVALES
jgi:hypothetical protein